MQVVKLFPSFKKDKSFAILWNSVAGLLIVAWFCLLFSKGTPYNSYTTAYSPQDTIPKKPKVYSVSYDLNTWARKMDTLNTIHGLIGKSLTVDQAEMVKGYLSNVISGMIIQINQQQAADTVKQKNK